MTANNAKQIWEDGEVALLRARTLQGVYHGMGRITFLLSVPMGTMLAYWLFGYGNWIVVLWAGLVLAGIIMLHALRSLMRRAFGKAFFHPFKRQVM